MIIIVCYLFLLYFDNDIYFLFGSMIKKLLEWLKHKNEGQTEFIQATTEVLESLKDFLKKNPQYTELWLLERIVEPERIIIFRVSWVNDAWITCVNRWYRVQFNSAVWPYKWWLRFHPSVNLSILKFLGFEQIFKNALTGLPLWWAKWWSDFDPKGKSDNEIMRFCQAFMSELYRHIWPSLDVPAWDIWVWGREIWYLFGMYKKLAHTRDGAITWKWLSYWGSLMRTEATGYGVVYFAKHMLEYHWKNIKGQKVLVSWSWNVAQYTIEKCIEFGAKVLTASDSSGTIFVKEGITTDMLEKIKHIKNVVYWRLESIQESFPEIVYFTNKKPWDIVWGIAIPCATENEIELKDAENLYKNWIFALVEWANMPTTLDAVHFIQWKWMLFAPWKAANAWWVATSGLEMSQNSLRLSWTREEVDQKLQKIMKEIHDSCVAHGLYNKKIDYIRWANISWFIKVAEAMLAQWIV